MREYTRDQFRLMMATVAVHGLGDVSSPEPDLAIIRREDDEAFYGEWVFGAGAMGIRFPKATTRRLTPEEVERWNYHPYLAAGNMPALIRMTPDGIDLPATIEELLAVLRAAERVAPNAPTAADVIAALKEGDEAE